MKRAKKTHYNFENHAFFVDVRRHIAKARKHVGIHVELAALDALDEAFRACFSNGHYPDVPVDPETGFPTDGTDPVAFFTGGYGTPPTGIAVREVVRSDGTVAEIPLARADVVAAWSIEMARAELTP